MKGMRNRLTHVYFDIRLNIIWETVRSALPQLLEFLLGFVRMRQINTIILILASSRRDNSVLRQYPYHLPPKKYLSPSPSHRQTLQ
ncbi:DUF86 domain-containing protein [Glaciimonas sp. PCH181]|uniref:HepT-like ribonuclease domain-containing protein n=1 Tax=Glaciimonas sp. PCH181 TaxID=2133943 RepID=UPI00351A39E2